MSRSIKVLVTGVAALFATSASASDFGHSSSATMTITVTIPPFLAALAAQQDGAVGLWTVTDDKNALMIKAPDLVVGKENETAIYFGRAMLFSVAPEVGTELEIKATGTTSDNGLRRQSYSVSTPSAQEVAPRTNATMIISAI